MPDATSDPSRPPLQADQPAAAAPARGLRVALSAAVIAFVVVLAAGATIWGRQLSADEPTTPTATLDARTATGAEPSPPVRTTRLEVQGPRRLLDPAQGGTLGAEDSAEVALPALPARTSAVLLQVSVRAAEGPGAVRLRSGTDRVTALRVAAAGGQTTATVVLGVRADDVLRVRTEGGGQLQIDLVGAFAPAAAARSGRIVPTRATRLVDLVPAEDGNNVEVDLTQVPALRTAGPISAALIQVSGDVGEDGGHARFGTSDERFDQTVYWSATSGQDRLRPGFLVLPVRGNRLRVEYHAGLRMRADLVGVVTGADAQRSTDGLVVPLPAGGARPVKVTVDGGVDATIVPTAGIAGLAPDRVAAALLTVTAAGAEPGAVSVRPPGAEGGALANVSAGQPPRSALALTRVVDGAVNVAAADPAVVTLTPRALVVGD